MEAPAANLPTAAQPSAAPTTAQPISAAPTTVPPIAASPAVTTTVAAPLLDTQAPPELMTPAEQARALAELRAQHEISQTETQTMAATIASMHEQNQTMVATIASMHAQMTATHEQTTARIETQAAALAQTLADMQATGARLDRQQEPIKLLATTMVKIAGLTLVGAAVAATIALARRRHRNDVAGAA